MKNENHIKKTVIALVLIIICLSSAFGQDTFKKVSFMGQARAQFYGDRYRAQTETDTVTPAKQNSGNTLVDLGVRIRPNKNMEVLGMVRIRNDYGGFWGAGVSFDMRQLYVKGILGNVVRYSLGDINYRMSRYTLWNYDQELISQSPFFLQQQTDVVNYDHFYYNDHSWRQQGGSAEMGFQFSKWIQEINLKAVGTRMKTSDFQTASDRLFSGFTAELIQSKALMFAVNYVNVFDVKGTSRNTSTFHQPLLTGQFEARKQLNEGKIKFLASSVNRKVITTTSMLRQLTTVALQISLCNGFPPPNTGAFKAATAT
jgi:hypothetical protein